MKSLHEPAAAEVVDSADSLVGQLADDYLRRCEAGEQPSVAEYADRYPEHAERIRGALAMLSLLKHSSAIGSGAVGDVVQHHSPLSGVLGDFRILHEIGRGGMGVVYEAEQISLGRRVALKILSFASILDPRQLTRFQNEARATATLNHPHIVPVFTTGVERGVHYLAMRLIDGESLASYGLGTGEKGTGKGETAVETTDAAPAAALAPSPRYSGERAGVRGEAGTDSAPHPNPLPGVPGRGDTFLRTAKGDNAESTLRAAALSTLSPRDLQAWYRRVAQWGTEAADALDHAHGLGIVHRDIKPGNLLVDGQGKLWVTDFGLARLPTDAGLTMTGDLLGTLRYMSPEQALARHGLVDHRTDIYSLGATLYELLTGQPAVVGHDRQQILKSLAENDPTPVRKIAPQVPVDLETVVLKALGHEPSDRYTSARDFSIELMRVLNHEPILAKRAGLIDRAVKWSRRRIVALLSVLLFLFVTSVTLSVAALLIAGARNDAIDKGKAAKEEHRRAVEMLVRLDDTVNEAYQAIAHLPVKDDARRRMLEGHVRVFKDFQGSEASNLVIERLRARAYHRLAHQQIDQGNLESAANNFEQAIAINEWLLQKDPKSLELHLALAECWMNFGRVRHLQQRTADAELFFQRAVGYAEQALSQSPNDPAALVRMAWPHGQLGLLYADREEFEEAKASYDREIELHERALVAVPGDFHVRTFLAAAHWSKAVIQQRSGDMVAAIEQISQGLKIERELYRERPSDYLTRTRMAMFLGERASWQLAVGRDEEAALADIKEAEGFNVPHLVNNSAWLLCRFAGGSNERYVAAERLARRALLAAPDDHFTLNTLGAALYRTNRFPEALESLKRSEAIKSNKTDDLLFLTMTTFQLGDVEVAQSYLERARTSINALASPNLEYARILAEAERLVQSVATTNEPAEGTP